PALGWLFVEHFDPAATVLGTNFAIGFTGGVDIAWPSCQTGVNGHVTLETIDALNICPSACSFSTILGIVQHSHPSNQFFQCPLFVLCDAPVYTTVCIGDHVTACRNPEPPHANNAMCSQGAIGGLNTVLYTCYNQVTPEPPTCTVAIDTKSW